MNFRFLLSILTITAAAAQTVAAEHAAASRLANGRWVKIKVAHEGIQQISHAQLREWGFDDPSRVNVYGYGGTALALERIGAGSDDIAPTASVHTADGRLLFYGDADLRYDLRSFDATEDITKETGTFWRRNIYDDGGYYFLSDCEEHYSAPVIAAPGSEGESVYTGHMHVDITDIDRLAPIGMGSVFCERSFSSSDPYTFDFSFLDCVPSELSDGPARNAVLVYHAMAPNSAGDLSGAQVVHTLQGDAAAFVSHQSPANPPKYSVDDYLSMNGSIVFSGIADSHGTLSLSRPAVAEKFTYYMDRHALVYPRLNRLPQDCSQLIMQYPVSQQGLAIRIADATPSQQLWDVSNPAAVRILEMQASGDDAIATMPESYSRANPGRLMLFDTAGSHYRPQFVCEVAPQNIHGGETPALAIITTAENEPYARILAEAHERIDGIKVGVYLNEQVLNEFASGANTPMAYRRLARMLYDRNPAEFRYILLLGASNWDHRGITETHPSEMLAIHECAVPSARMNTNTCYASDAFVGCLDDVSYLDAYKAPMTVAVGRIPAHNQAEAASMVQHTVDYIENPPAASSYYHALMASAPADAYEHYYYCDAVADELAAGGHDFIISRLPLIAYPMENNKYVEARRRLTDHLSEGRGLFTYFGHSEAGNILTSSSFYSCAVADALNYDTPPYAVLATCNAFAIDNNRPCVANSMLAKRGGGAIGIIAATRSVFSDYNRIFAVSIARAYAAAQPGQTTGDIFRNGYNNLMNNSTTGVRYNTRCYNLCGDPAVRLPIAEKTITLDAAGSDGAASPAMGLAALTLRGHIDAGDGTADTAFNGTADIIVYDTPVSGTIQVPDASAKQTPDIVIDNSRLATVSVPVHDGTWSAEIFLPAFSNPGKTYAVGVDAGNAEGTSAHGYFSALPTAAETASADGVDTSAPEITEMYIGSPDFTDGDLTGADITVFARIHIPTTGLNINAAPLTGASRITLDGSDTRSNISGYMQQETDNTLLLSMPYSNLSDGRHTITLTVANNLGHTSGRTVGFTVRGSAAAASLSVAERPARTQATLSLDHNLGNGASATLIIENHTGDTVHTSGDTTSWDLTDNDGLPVPDGIYYAYVLLRSGLHNCHTQPVEIIVVRDNGAQ